MKMEYHVKQISKKQQQLEIVKLGISQMYSDQVKKIQGSIVSVSDDVRTIEFENASKIAERLNAGFELVKDLEDSIVYHNNQIKEIKAKQKS
ncbi:MAG: hypothetical protein K2L70_06640 [Clostridia bacterium]|nr:hypothetical protein [Clostridia bacterium]